MATRQIRCCWHRSIRACGDVWSLPVLFQAQQLQSSPMDWYGPWCKLQELSQKPCSSPSSNSPLLQLPFRTSREWYSLKQTTAANQHQQLSGKALWKTDTKQRNVRNCRLTDLLLLSAWELAGVKKERQRFPPWEYVQAKICVQRNCQFYKREKERERENTNEENKFNNKEIEEFVHSLTDMNKTCGSQEMVMKSSRRTNAQKNKLNWFPSLEANHFNIFSFFYLLKLTQWWKRPNPLWFPGHAQ